MRALHQEWSPPSRLALFLIAACSLSPSLAEGAALIWGQWHGYTGKALRDGVDFWAGGFLAVHHRLGVLFDVAAYRHFLAAHFGQLPPHIWSYPPNYLLIARAFGWLAPWPAVLAFDAAGIVLLILVLRLARSGKWLALAVILSPASLANLLAGQNGIWLAALIGGGLLLIPTRPRLAGILVGLATIKPQLGIPLPLHLLRRSPLAFAYAMLGAVALAGLSASVFGLTAWVDFWRITRPLMQQVLVSGQPKVFAGGLISVFALARPLGIPAALAVQTVVSLGAVAVAARMKKPAAVLILAAIASPYLHGYDLVGVALAIALQVEKGLARGFFPGEPALFFVAWTGPGLLVWFPGLAPLAPVVLGLLLVSAAWHEAPHATPRNVQRTVL
ncbi:MAG: glycosyltransferase family 87 protein [Acetobacteraceae bacterium]